MNLFCHQEPKQPDFFRHHESGKVPLPETGGIGRLGIYLVGMIGCAFSIWYLFEKEEGS